MSESTSIQRLTDVLEAYGADAAHWPQDERTMLLELIAGSPAASDLLHEAQKLDRILDLYSIPEASNDLMKKVLNNLPVPNRLDQFLKWLWPERKSLIWQPALAASLPLVFGILLGSFWTPLDQDYAMDEEGMYVMGLYTPEELEP